MGNVKPKVFKYQNELEWKGERKGFLSEEGKPGFMVATPPEFRGHPNIWSPEDLFVAVHAQDDQGLAVDDIALLIEPVPVQLDPHVERLIARRALVLLAFDLDVDLLPPGPTVPVDIALHNQTSQAVSEFGISDSQVSTKLLTSSSLPVADEVLFGPHQAGSGSQDCC